MDPPGLLATPGRPRQRSTRRGGSRSPPRSKTIHPCFPTSAGAARDRRRVMSAGDPVVSMIGSGSAPAMLAARALLAGNGVAHRWIDTDTDPVGRLLADRARLGVERPVAVFADGAHLPAPDGFVDPGPARIGREPEEAPAVREQRVG